MKKNTFSMRRQRYAGTKLSLNQILILFAIINGLFISLHGKRLLITSLNRVDGI